MFLDWMATVKTHNSKTSVFVQGKNTEGLGANARYIPMPEILINICYYRLILSKPTNKKKMSITVRPSYI